VRKPIDCATWDLAVRRFPALHLASQDLSGEIVLTNNFTLKPEMINALYKQRWQVELLFKWIKATSAYQSLSGHKRERCKDENMDCCQYLCPHYYRQKTLASDWQPLRDSTNPESDYILNNTNKSTTYTKIEKFL